jgi:WD40 repeat protein
MLTDMKRLVLLLVLISVRALAAAPAKPAPILRLETGGHTAPIHHIGVDKSGRWLLTASADRTARIWDLQKKKPEVTRTIRLQMGAGAEGAIFAGAISPDGKLVVLSAYTTNNALYVIDRATGALVKYLPNLDETGLGLAFSADGKRLAVTSRHGILVFDTVKWKLLFDDGYYGASFSADFDPTGRLVTTSYDGTIRIYDASGKAISSAQPPAGKKAQEARFSPDGSTVAVGFADASDVSLFSGKDMAFLRSPDLFGLTEGVFNAIAWTRDGTNLIAGGTSQTPNVVVAPPKAPKEAGHTGRALKDAGSSYIVRSWSKGGSGTYVDFKPPVTDAILDLVTLPDGSVIYSSADASWGVISSKGELTKEYAPATPSYLGMRLRLSPDGKAARFAYLRGGRELASFSVKDLTLLPGASLGTTWLPDDKKDTKAPRKAPGEKVALPIGPREVVRAMAAGSNDAFFVFGTDVALRSVDQKGNVLWEGAVPAAVRAVAISSDDKLAVVAYGDGTIRWHRAADGAPLLTLFPHADRQRWVAYTPSGYFADSRGGDSLVHFVENAGAEKLPKESLVTAYTPKFHRPDVVSRILDTLDEGKALEEADAARKANPKGKLKAKP